VKLPVNIRVNKRVNKRVCTVAVALTASFITITPPSVAVAAGELTLVSQDFNLAVDGTFRFVVEFPDDI